ncbi:Intracisternal A-particle Pol-related polyprotein [Dictyocoela muelleri]|nr:Intracisternal A-particle Pol-related polyprotein [Dictyocoela muelleri]
MIDLCTRFSSLILLKNITANNISKQFEHEWLLKYPLPSTLYSDNGKQFVSKKFKKLLSDYNIRPKLTIPYNPRGNGIIIRSHKTLIEQLRHLKNIEIKRALQLISNAYNSTYSNVLKCSPLQLAFGRHKISLSKTEDLNSLIKKY